MPSSINGCGTGLVKASPAYNDQYDAIESVILVGVPLLPYRAIHVTSIWDDYNVEEPGAAGKRYRYIPLRLSPGILFRGLLNGWANVAMVISPIFAAVPLFDRFFGDKNPKFSSVDMHMFMIAGILLGAGVLMKLLWFLSSRKGALIKRIIHFEPGWAVPTWKSQIAALGTDVGCSDPFYWPQDVALDFSVLIASREGTPDLNSLVERYLAQGDFGSAMLYARLAMRLDEKSKARALMRQVIKAWRRR